MRPLAVLALLAAVAVVPASAAPQPAKVLSRSTTVGTVLVDARGRTLYLYGADKPRTSVCYGACATAWPPFLTSAKPSAGSGIKLSLLGMTKRRDGRLQVTYAGHPLYFFARDTKAGQLKGQGTSGIWWVVGPSGSKITKSFVNPPSTTVDNPPDGGYGP